MKELFEKYKEYLHFVITHQNIIELHHLVEKRHFRKIYYHYKELVLLIVLKHYETSEKFEICEEIYQMIYIMNQVEGKNISNSIEKFIEKRKKEEKC